MTEIVTDEKFKSRVSLNLVTNIIQTALTALIGLLMVPYYLTELGISVYAIIPLATSITTYALAITEPLGSSFARYMFKAIREENDENINKTYSSAVFGMGKLVLFLIPIILAISYLAPTCFDTNNIDDFEVQILFASVFLSAMVFTFSSCLGCVFEAYNKLYISYTIKTIYCVLQTSLIVILFTESQPSLIHIGVAYVAASLSMLIGMYVCAKRTCPILRLSYKNYDKAVLRNLMNLGFWTVVSNLGTMLYINASIIICNIMMGSTEQGLFAIAANAISMISTAANTIATIVIPLIYDAYSNENKCELIDTLKFFIKLIGVMMAFPIAYLMVFLPQIIEIWIGTGYDGVYTLLYIMLPANIAICSIKAISYVPIAYEKVRPSAEGMVIFGVVNVILSILLVSFTNFGTTGICLAWTVSMILSQAGFTVLYTSYLMKIKKSIFYPNIIIGYLPFLLLLFAGYVFTELFTVEFTLITLIISFVTIGIIYTAITTKLLFNKDEKKMIVSYLPKSLQKFL